MEGKNCFRTRWTQEPLYSGGNIASLALPRRSFEYLRSQQQEQQQQQVQVVAQQGKLDGSGLSVPALPEFDEALVMACGDTIHVVRAGTGAVVCSYTLPVEDVILHVDAVSVLSEDQPATFGRRAMARGVASEAAETSTAPPPEETGGTGGHKRKGVTKGGGKGRKSNAAAKAEEAPTEVKTEPTESGTAAQDSAEAGSPELAVPMGCYVACGTRSLQLYMLQVVVSETVPVLEAEQQSTTEETDDIADAPTSAARRARETVEPVVSYELRVLRYWTAAQQAISVVSFSTGGQFLISGSTDGGIKVWNAFHHHLTHNFRCPSGSLLQSLYLDPSESFLLSGSFEGHVSVFDFVGKTLLAHSRPHVQAVDGITLTDDGAHVLSIARDRRLSIQRLTPASQTSETATTSGRKRGQGAGSASAAWTLQEARAVVVKEHISAALFEDSNTLHVGSMDGILTTYHVDASEGNTGPAVTAVCRNEKPPASKAEEANEETMMKCVLLCGRPKGSARFSTWKGFQVEDRPRSSQQRSSLYVADAGYNISRLDYEAHSNQYRTRGTLVGFLDQILDIKTFSPGCPRPDFPYDRVVVNNSKDVRLYGTQGCFSGQVLQGHADVVMCCAVSSDGSLVATGGKDMQVRFWSTETWQTVAVGVKGHTAEITSMCFNAKQAASYHLLFTISADENLRLWDVGQHVLPRLAKHAASAAHGKQAPVEFENRAGVNSAHAGPVFAIAVAPNDQYVATGGKDKVVHLWNISGKKLYKEATLKGHRRGISALSFSPADRVLASASNDGSVRLWSLSSLTCVKTLQSDKVAVLQVNFFNNGTQLVTGNAEGVLRVWAVAASEAVWSAEAHQEKVWALSVIETDGDTVFLSGAADGVLIATEDYTAEEVERIKQERHDVILKEQSLNNAIRRGEFTDAFGLALQLNHPRHLRQVLVRWCSVDAAQCEDTLRCTLLPGLSDEHLLRLLQFTREWITNSRHCMVASLVIYCFLGSQHFEELAKLPAMQNLVEPLLAYSQRHSHRQHDLLRRTYYIDYVTQAGLSTSSSGQRTLTRMPPFVNGEGKRELPEDPTQQQGDRESKQHPPTKKVRA